MAYMFVVGECVACKTVITFNADKVPSIRVNGVREPICAGCFRRWNLIHRVNKGLNPLPLDPEAYEPQEVA